MNLYFFENFAIYKFIISLDIYYHYSFFLFDILIGYFDYIFILFLIFIKLIYIFLKLIKIVFLIFINIFI